MSSVAAPIPSARAGRHAGAAALAGFALFLLVVIGALAGGQVGSSSFSPSAVAIADIPANYLAAYQSAAARYGVDWAVLAAIGKVECDHGRNRASGCNPPGSVNGAGATGPMQFLGSTWRRGTPAMAVPTLGAATISIRAGYATDGDGDGLADVWNPADAIAGGARLLRSNGAPTDYRRAIYAYNHAGWYVDRVMAQADEYRGAFAPGAAGGARAALAWAVSRVGRFTYSLGPPTDRGGSVQDMQTREPSSSTCDCSMFVRWSIAQAGIDVGLTTVTQWTANGLLPDSESAATTPVVSRGVGSSSPSGGYRPGDIIFFGHGPGGEGHDALWLGNGQIVQCSSSGGGSNIRPLAGYVAPTGWVRWRVVTG
ncbi:MAG: NlpC/P60 family protein [Gaiellaceae bacterium]